MRRTVIVSLMPPCFLAMMVPSKAWLRTRLPSLTRTVTRTVVADVHFGQFALHVLLGQSLDQIHSDPSFDYGPFMTGGLCASAADVQTVLLLKALVL